MKKVGGVLMMVLGLGLLGWIGYNLFIAMQPEAEGRSPIGPAIFAVALIGVGGKWVFSKQKDQKPNA